MAIGIPLKTDDESRLLRDIVDIGTTPEGKNLIDSLQKTLEEERASGDNIRDEVQLRQNQGRRQVLKDLVDIFTNAQTILERAENAKKSANRF